MKERTNNKKEQHIDNMTNDEVVNELKEKKLPTFGTGVERKDRLKKHYGNFIFSALYSQVSLSSMLTQHPSMIQL